jgi:hypothetical protein
MDARRFFAAFLAPASLAAAALLAACGGGGGNTLPSVSPQAAAHPASSQTTTTTASGTAVTIAQIAGGNNGGGAGYTIVTAAAPNAGDVMVGGLTVSLSGGVNRTTSLVKWNVLDALAQSQDTNGNLAASSYTNIVSVGESNTQTVSETGGNWASAVIYDVTNADTTSPIAADQWSRGSGNAVTCPSVTTARAGSLLICEVYLDTGTANASVVQTPSPGAGWAFDRASGSQYEEVFGFHATAPTTAGQTIPAMQFNLKNGSGYLANWLAETIAVQPPNPTAVATPMPWPASAVETPGMADAFVDSVGVNIHLGFAGTLYQTNFPQVLSLLQGLDVRHVRDGIVLGQSTICSEYQQLLGDGIRVDDVTSPGMNQQTITQWGPCAGGALEAVEGPNELDMSGDSNWAATDIATQQNLYPAVKAAAPGLTVFGPAVTSSAAYAALGDLSSYEDFGNMHDYMAGRNPGNPGWGSTDQFGTYGSLAWNMAVAKQASVSRSLVATETGYTDTVGATDWVPAATKGRYEMRLLLEHWLAGVQRTYLYELIDTTNDSFIGYGLTDAAGNPKPAYVAIQHLLAHLRDPGPAFTPTPLQYAVGAASPVQHVLLQKRNGTYELILWVEASEWNALTATATSVAPQPVTLTFLKTPSSLTQTTIGDDGTTQQSALTVTAGKTTLTATNDVQIIDITP